MSKVEGAHDNPRWAVMQQHERADEREGEKLKIQMLWLSDGETQHQECSSTHDKESRER